MNERLKSLWLHEEKIAHIHGWDFSHIEGRYEEENDLPWDYRQVVDFYRKPHHQLLDMDTGGGEFLLSLGHPHENLSATEGYEPNVQLCKEVLLPLGVDFREADAEKELPFEEDRFDLVINRHGSFNAREIFRVLKPGGMFITQQVGAENDRELVEMLLPGTPVPFPGQTLAQISKCFQKAGFCILDGQEAFRPIRFFDTGALVWFARIIEWEFPVFSVESCLAQLQAVQRIIDEKGFIEGRIHRILLAAKKPE